MGLGTLIEQAREAHERTGLRGAVRHTALQTWGRSLGSAGTRIPNSVWNRSGMNVYDRDWDALILLDACRPDMLSAVAPEYWFLPEDIGTVTSVGSSSQIWMYNTFNNASREDLAETTFVSANAFTRDLGDVVPGKECFGEVVEVWRDAWDDELGVTRPRDVTKAAAAAARESESERTIIHYMQPHIPHPTLPVGEGAAVRSEWSVWNEIRSGNVSREEFVEAYLETLRWVLDDVALLLHVCDFDRPVISADHAELLGEYGLYGHPELPVPTLREVPWVEPEAPVDGFDRHVTEEDTEDVESFVPADRRETDAVDVNERLRALGYRE